MKKIYLICDSILDKYFESKIENYEVIRSINEFDINDIEEYVNKIDFIYIQESIYFDNAILDELLAKYQHLYYHRIPSINNILGSATSEKIENLNYEMCFNKEQVDILKDFPDKSEIEGKVVLVAGAAGSIGSEITKQLVKLNPKKIVLLDINENRLYFLELHLKANNFKRIEVVSGNIQDEQRMEYVFETFKPDLLFHAAASKHVPLSEMNPAETIKNNVIGTYILFKLADKYELNRAVLISTDKAVNPTNVMGATKRLAEIIVSSIEYKKTKVATVRFGNVFASEGSLLHIFQEQLRNKRPLTVTDNEVTRYFMSIQEAAQLVITASILLNKNELFVLDMGEPVKIYDLAERILDLVGMNVGINVVGLRPGEKLFEELIYDKDNTIKTSNDKIFISTGEVDSKIDADELIADYKTLVTQHSNADCIERLRKDVVTFDHNKNY